VQEPDFVFRRNRRVHFNRPGGGHQFIQLLAAEVCASAVVMLDTPCCGVVWRVLATHTIRQSLSSPPVHHRVPSRFSWTVHNCIKKYSDKYRTGCFIMR